jgi:hypothetical protein
MLESLGISFHDEAHVIRIGYLSNAYMNHPGKAIESHPAFTPVRETFPADGRVRRCPASHDYLMGSFSIGIAYDMRFCVRKTPEEGYWVEYDRSFTSLPEQALPHAISLDDIESGLVQLNIHPNWLFLSDTPDVQMVIIPAVGQTNPEPFRGQLNIYNWVRHTSYAFRARVDEWVTISKNSPIMAVKFLHPTETHFVLGEIRRTDEITEHSRYMDLHNIIGGQTFASWRKIFSFNGKRRPKRLMYFIEDEE